MRARIRVLITICLMMAISLCLCSCSEISQREQPAEKITTVDAGTWAEAPDYNVIVGNPVEIVTVKAKSEEQAFIKIPVAITATSKTVISCSFFGMSYRQHGSYYEKLEYCIPQEIKMEPKDSYSGFLYYKWKPKKSLKSVTDSTSHTEWQLTYDGEALMDEAKN